MSVARAPSRRSGAPGAVLRPFLLALGLLSLLPSPCLGAPPPPGLDPSKALTQLGLDTWTTDHGLPNATVTAVLQTRQGYVWLATYDGLARFDGSRFTVFTQADGLGNNGIRALCEDRDGSLWVGTNGGGLARLSHGRFHRFTTADGLPSNIVWSLHTDVRDGSVWIGTNGGGLARHRAGRIERFEPTDSGRTVAAIAQEDDGTLWLATQADGLRRRGPDGRFTTFSPADGLPRGLVAAVALGSGGTVWGGSSEGLFLVRDGRVAALPAGLEPLRSAIVSSVVEDARGSLWVGTNGSGVARFAQGQVTFLGSRDGVGDVVYGLHADRDGTLWVGTNGAGVSRLRDGSFTAYTVREGLSRDFAYTTFEDRAGTLWAGTAGGLDRFERGGFAPASPPFERPVAVRSIAEGGDGALWIGTYGAGVWRRLGERWQAFTSRDGLAHDTVRAVLVDRQERVWAATNGGLSVREQGVWRSYRVQDGLPSNSLIGLAEDRDGALWVGSDGSGLSRFREGRFQTFTSKDGLASDVVLALFVDATGALWVATNGGLSRFAGGRFTSFSSAAGLPSDSVTQVAEDARGDLWVGSSRGVSRVRRSSFESRSAGGPPRLEIETFDHLDGMKSGQCTAPGQPAGFRSRDGRLWFATTRGVASVDPERPRLITRPPSVVVEEVTVDGKPVPFDGGVEVGPGASRLELRYARLSAQAPQRTAVRFQLEGFDPGWVDAADRRRADYTHVPPGTYTFRIAARAGSGHWGEPGAGLRVRVRPRFTQTWPFALASALALAGLLTAGYRLRVRSLHARERQLTRLVDERTRHLAAQKQRAEEAHAEAARLLAERERVEAELRRQGGYLASLHETALAVMDRLETQQLLQALVERAAALLEAPEGFLFFEAPDGVRLERRVWAGSRPRDEFVAPGEGAVGQAWASGTAVVVDDYDTWPGRSPQVPAGMFGALVAVPLHFGGKDRGVLGVAHAAGTRRFGPAETALLSSFAQLASLALDNARLFEREHAARETAERLQAATRALSSTIDRHAVTDLILVELEKVVPCDASSIQALSHGLLEVIAGHGHAAGAVGRRIDPAAGDGRSLEVLDGRRPVIRGSAVYPDESAGAEPPGDERSWMGVPLVFGDRAIGMLSLNKKERGFYTEAHAERAAAFAAQAAVAIENARLYGAVRDELAERTRAQQELARSEARYRDLFEQSLGLLCTHDLDGVLLSVNPAAARALGRSADELVGRPLAELLPPESRPLFSSYLAHVREHRAAAGTFVVLDARGEPRTWRYRNVLSDRSEGPAFVIGFSQDVTEEETAQAALRESELRFRQLAENIDALFFIRSIDPPRFLYVSPAFERIWGRPATLGGREFIATIHPDDREALAAAVSRQEEGYDHEYRILRPDGSVRWVHSRAFPIPDKRGRVSRVAGIAEDVTVRKSVEQMRDELVRTLVHDLRNPLTSMLASMDLLEASLSGPESRGKVEMVRLARRGGIKLRSLVDAILDVSRLEQGAMPLAQAPVDVAAAVAEAFELQRPLAEPRRLGLVNEVPPDLPRAWADRDLLSRILQNLIGNAIKFAPSGGEVRVGASAAPDDPRMVRITVADDGPGLPPEIRDRVFEKFVTGRHERRGSGLGLPFCRLAVEAHGGRIRAESPPDGGTFFTFTLPAASEEALAGAPGTP